MQGLAQKGCAREVEVAFYPPLIFYANVWYIKNNGIG